MRLSKLPLSLQSWPGMRNREYKGLVLLEMKISLHPSFIQHSSLKTCIGRSSLSNCNECRSSFLFPLYVTLKKVMWVSNNIQLFKLLFYKDTFI